MDIGVYLDLIAIIPPTIGILFLLRQKVSIIGVNAGSVSRLSLGFISAVIFDILRLFGYDWAVYGILASLWLMFNAIGTFSANFYYSPESRSFRQSLSRLRRNPSFYVYHGYLIIWLTLNVVVPSLYLQTTLVLFAFIIFYPTRLFLLAKKRTNIARVKDMLTVLTGSWIFFVTTALALFALGTTPPVLQISLPSAWEVAFLTSSAFLLLMSKAVIDPSGLARSWTALLVPETMIKTGKRYLIIHDSGAKTLSFLTSSFKSLIAGGARIVVKASASNPLVQDLIKSDQHFSQWMTNGKLVTYSLESEKNDESKEGISGKLGLGSTSTVYVTELNLGNLAQNQFRLDPHPNSSELFLLETSKAPRSQVADLISQNTDLQLLDLSERASPFSSRVQLDHAKLQRSSILLEYDSASDYEDTVDKFLTEAIANAELPVLFTSKSSKLYRSIKGKRMVKMIVASSLVSSPDELSGGEIQIPDRELGLVTSIASDFLENNKNMAVSFVFDSLTDLIRGERWEQIYSGVKQIVELLTVPNANALFLANRDSFEPRFLGALRSLFSVQMRLGGSGLQLAKLGTT